MQLITNLNFSGQCEEAFSFYSTILGAELSEINRYSEMPSDPTQPDQTLPEEFHNQVMHVNLSKNGNMILMGADILPMMSPNEMTIGNNVEICIVPDSRAEADRIFAALSQGGNISMPMEDMFWGDYFGACTDKYGIGWMINYGEKNN